jgi:universal stress protein B
MISGDTILLALMFVTLVNIVRYVTALRSLIYIMREAHPLLYQQVDGPGFFTTHGNMNKQVRLFHYIRSREYLNHHDPLFVEKCERVREIFSLTVALIGLTLVSAVIL